MEGKRPGLADVEDSRHLECADRCQRDSDRTDAHSPHSSLPHVAQHQPIDCGARMSPTASPKSIIGLNQPLPLLNSTLAWVGELGPTSMCHPRRSTRQPMGTRAACPLRVDLSERNARIGVGHRIVERQSIDHVARNSVAEAVGTLVDEASSELRRPKKTTPTAAPTQQRAAPANSVVDRVGWWRSRPRLPRE